ncbi:universal stress protein [Streptomyces sp. NBC_00885]|uniref:universal stress protein n=1 Tax=Streptomyces sp. NBC_00885 TaxID=2975857 RepID=UPI0038678163|nr:universal stress protein [Streptomyces sp. NBC_00885]
MTRPVITAVDGSAESRAAAQWAAREARMRALPLHILEVSQPTARRRPAAPQGAQSSRRAGRPHEAAGAPPVRMDRPAAGATRRPGHQRGGCVSFPWESFHGDFGSRCGEMAVINVSES